VLLPNIVTISDAALAPGDRGGPIGWATYQPVGQTWLYRYYGNVRIMKELYNSTERFIKLLDSNPPGVPLLSCTWTGDPSCSNFSSGGQCAAANMHWRMRQGLTQDLATGCLWRSHSLLYVTNPASNPTGGSLFV